jgi:hypothetical protein
MAPTKKPQKAAKKEKVFHPESRKAGQLARKQLRKSKLAGQASKRVKLHSSKGKLSDDVPVHSIPTTYVRDKQKTNVGFFSLQPIFTDFSSTLYPRKNNPTSC